MSRIRILYVALFLFVLMAAVPVAHAQSDVGDIEFSEIVDALGPRTGEALFLDVLLYGLFFLGMISSFLIPDKQMFVSLLNFGTLGMVIISKLLVGTHSSAIFEPCDLPVLAINAVIFIFPLMGAGMLRSVKGKTSKALMPMIIMGLLGGGYFFMFWVFEQRDSCDNTEAALQAAEYVGTCVFNGIL